MKNLLAGLMILAAAAVFLVSHCAPGEAQNIQVGRDQQQRNTEQATVKTTSTGPGGEKIEKEVRTNKNLATQSSGKYEYSGMPGKWMRGEKKAKDEPTGKN